MRFVTRIYASVCLIPISNKANEWGKIICMPIIIIFYYLCSGYLLSSGAVIFPIFGMDIIVIDNYIFRFHKKSGQFILWEAFCFKIVIPLNTQV